MNKHTPGPWIPYWSIKEEAGWSSGRAPCELHSAAEGHASSVVLRLDSGMLATAPDARLMCAAPELLAALERVMQRAPDCVCAECEQARAAIRKAKGEG